MIQKITTENLKRAIRKQVKERKAEQDFTTHFHCE